MGGLLLSNYERKSATTQQQTSVKKRQMILKFRSESSTSKFGDLQNEECQEEKQANMNSVTLAMLIKPHYPSPSTKVGGTMTRAQGLSGIVGVHQALKRDSALSSLLCLLMENHV